MICLALVAFKNEKMLGRKLLPLYQLERRLYAMAASDSDLPSPSSASGSGSVEPSVVHFCQWLDCTQSFVDPESLYNHLCNDHIGRKSTNNLCLTCRWKDCGTSCAKRDHITSHLRVHTPLKPHVCEICKKCFKRPQDLKKHEKIHTEEHHAQHKHSKAITVADPAYVSRVRKDPGSDLLESKSEKDKPALTPSRSLSHSSASPESSLPTPSPELAPARHHSHHSPLHDSVFLHNHATSAWEGLRSDPTHISTGSKRSHDHDYNVDDFFTDMKKRRVNPSYDSNMAERLNTLTYGHPQANPSFNPRSVSLDIRTPEELAAVNEFLVTLGRDVSSSISSSRPGHHSVHASSAGFSSESYFDPVALSQLGLTGMPGLPTPDDFAPAPSVYAGNSPTNTHLSQRSTSSAMYSGIHSAEINHAPSHARRSSRYSPHHYEYHGGSSYHQPTPPLDPGSGSPHSAAATPLNTTPPHMSLNMHGVAAPFSNGGRYPPLTSAYPQQSSHPSQFGIHINPSTESAAAFDYIRPPRGPGPDVGLMMGDAIDRSMRRPIMVLKSIPAGAGYSTNPLVGIPPEPLEPKLSSVVLHRGPPAKLSTLEESSKKLTPVPSGSTTSSSLYPTLTLTEGNKEFKLAPLHSKYRSASPPASSPASRASTPSSVENSPRSHSTVLPSLKSLAAAGSVSLDPQRPFKRSLAGDSDELAREVGKIELAGSTTSSPVPSKDSLSSSPSSLSKKSPHDATEKRNIPFEERRRHAEFIRTLLVQINENFQRQSRLEASGKVENDDRMDVDEATLNPSIVKDVEMCSA
ncbi:hypothetical protein D9757_004601 [Collybiopsis confluens]|uniref:pH-response transcription factor pacC/RIM101 n=1 Tax=Collybiopsis confluens TaxID=2823264 RepID=A0A8H5HSB9_9AGAR|nr:hypothetical protein D9757_004601 [Collybiopsis confluens]